MEAKADCIEQLKSSLEAVIKPSREEETNIDYRLHQCEENPAQFILYENWRSKEEHALQFQKPYILKLLDEITDLLAGPYQAYTAHELQTTNSVKA
jgi:quinol monooxygenase YgiN